MSILAKLPFHDEKAAFEYLERTLWPDGPVCPHCGTIGNATKLQGREGEGKRQARIGLWKCKSKECRKQFTVKVGTVFEHGRLPLHKFLQAAYLMCCSKKGVSAHQLHRVLQISYKAAWFLAHRIREAMRDGTLAPIGGPGGVIEVDETFIGRLEGQPKNPKGGYAHKNVVLTLVERGGSARSFHIDNASVASVVPLVRDNIRRESELMTDQAQHYKAVGQEFAGHGSVDHSAYEWGRGEIHTNTVEGFYSIFKRGMKGIYQHCGEKHLHRYLAEFDFRYSNRSARGIEDTERTTIALRGMTGKRLTYQAADN